MRDGGFVSGPVGDDVVPGIHHDFVLSASQVEALGGEGASNAFKLYNATFPSFVAQGD